MGALEELEERMKRQKMIKALDELNKYLKDYVDVKCIILCS